MTTTAKRNYNRRSDEERIAELQSRIESLQKRLETRQRPDQPVIREIPKVQRRLRRFAQMAVQHGRDDLANSTMAFIAGLDRMAGIEATRRRSRSNGEE